MVTLPVNLKEKKKSFFSGGETACFEKTLNKGTKNLKRDPPPYSKKKFGVGSEKKVCFIVKILENCERNERLKKKITNIQFTIET